MGEYGTRVCCKIIVLFIVMIAGYIAKKIGVLDKSSTKAMSGMLANITNPCLILALLQVDKNPGLMKNAGIVLLMSFAVHVFMSFFSGFIFKGVKDYRDRNVYTYGLTYMNCGFMGYPIVQAMFGDEGLFYGVMYTVVFNIFAWSHGVAVMNSHGGRSVDYKKLFLNPCIVSTAVSSVLYITNIRLPAVALEGVKMVGDMTIPLSMFIIGSLLGDQRLRELLKEYKLLGFSVLKLAVIPLIMVGVCLVIKDIIGFKVALICVTMCAAPTAANTAVVSELYDGNSGLAAKLVGVTTLFCLVSMPLILILAEKLFL